MPVKRTFKAAEPRRARVRGAGARDGRNAVVLAPLCASPACGGSDGPAPGPLARPSEGPLIAPDAACERSERKPGRPWRAAAPPLSTCAARDMPAGENDPDGNPLQRGGSAEAG